MPKVLFLCTGNYYRSRFAELLFNHLALTLCPVWEATSRALALERGVDNVGPISPLTVERLEHLGVAPPDMHREPARLSKADLNAADRVIALDQAEHRPLVEERHADWAVRHAGRLVYWNIGDVAITHPEVALKALERRVVALCHDLRGSERRPAGTPA